MPDAQVTDICLNTWVEHCFSADGSSAGPTVGKCPFLVTSGGDWTCNLNGRTIDYEVTIRQRDLPDHCKLRKHSIHVFDRHERHIG
jgi:hypothetical protein